MKRAITVAGIGEVLMDVFESGAVTLGGAPFNVAYHLHQLLTALSMGEACFLSAVGSDDWGRSIRQEMTKAGMSTSFLHEVERATGSALVFERDGGAGFEIQQNVAWDCILLDDTARDLARRCDAVVFGTLAQRSDCSRASIREFVAQVKGPRLYDVNLRRNTTDGVAGYTAEIIAESLRLATVVKMNDVEVEEVCELLGFTASEQEPEARIRQLMNWLCEEYSLDAVAITRGAKGAMLASSGEHFTLPDSDLDKGLIHPVGAGDSFAAGLLFGILQGWPSPQCLQMANTLSSWVALCVSATPPLPDSVLAQVHELVAQARVTTVA